MSAPRGGAMVQPCARCGSRWAVQGAPMHWCPRCRGVLLSPGPVDAPPERRNYRWVARPPGRRPRPSARPVSPPVAGPPRYQEIPRWGLHDSRSEPAPVVPGRLARLSTRVAGLLVLTAVLFVLAAVAEIGRYLILLRNRTRLIPQPLLLASDLSLYVLAGCALLAALLTAVALTGWLIRARRNAYAAVGEQDPRPGPMVWCGCLIPVVNLLWPGVFLTELARRGEPRALRAVRIWWCAWVLDGVLVVVALCWHTADSLQARADGVMISAYTDLAAAAVAVLSLWVVRRCEGRDLRGRERQLRRWVPASGPAAVVIEPVHRVGESADRAPEPGVGDDSDADRAASDPAPGAAEQEEVMAK
ncbi:DUF4328 domain-containing protein [Nocardia sp. alder85J]|uniref:DUF4328 domain-containing protein n=1 Tax=Nocardia sp. alder85J TaxID=2862949 RepID=UPI001CD771DE|nr:DUF4328 domain-containing protein [Nocardia sp. alder85J]MCX4096594.1 DUF4328 domain-containing protein [Nocardia sp. alder85J]